MDTTITNEQLYNKLGEVERMLASPKVEKGLWDMQDIASFAGVSVAYTYNFTKDPRFPAPVELTGRTGKSSRKLFLASDVTAFFEKSKAKKRN